MNNIDLFDFLLFFGLAVLVTVLYFLARGLIAWALKDDDQWNKKQGHLGYSKEETANRKKLAYDRLTAGYISILVVLALFWIIPLLG